MNTVRKFLFQKQKILFCFSYHMFNLLLPVLLSQTNWTYTTHFLQTDTTFYDFCGCDNFASYPTQPGSIWFLLSTKLKRKGETREIELTSLNPHTLILILVNENTKKSIKVYPVLWNDKYGLCVDSFDYAPGFSKCHR